MLDKKGFEDFFNLYYKPLCYYARKFQLDHFESEEVVQSVFVKLWEIRENITIERSVSAYLYYAVRNQCINHLKQKSILSRNKDQYISKIEHARLFAAISGEDGISALIAKEFEQQINQAIENLPVKCREIFLLSRKENLSMKEISDKLEVSTNTVQRQISIAITKLRETLKYYITVVFAILSHFF